MTPDIKSSCLDALTESASELTATVLGGVPFAALPERSEPMAGHGAYLGLVAEDEPIQVGILVEASGCQLLAKLLLGMEPADEDLAQSDVSDAMCEIVNIVAGGLKRRVSERMKVTMGLPIFVAGHPLPNQQQEVLARGLQIATVPVSLLLLTQKQHATPISVSGVTVQTAGKALAKEISA
jgi:Chemotaxis phosphatase CheX